MPMFSESKYVMVPSSSLIRALMTGWAFSAWAAAFDEERHREQLDALDAAANAAFGLVAQLHQLGDVDLDDRGQLGLRVQGLRSCCRR
ncbi:hypothetical protein SCALM49S_03244 [Streptomyces californicus]